MLTELHALFLAEAVKAAASIEQCVTQRPVHPTKIMLESVRAFNPEGAYDEIDIASAKSDVVHFIMNNTHPDKPVFQQKVGFGYVQDKR